MISSPPLIYVAPSVVSTKAKEFVTKMPDFAGGQVLRYTPIYAPRSSQIVFYEAKVVNSNLQNRGCIILTGDGTVVQFGTQGPSKYDQLRAKTSLSFKMVRLGPKYFAAEYRGLPVAELGTFPALRVNNVTNQLIVTSRSSNLGEASTGVSLADVLLARQYVSREAAYEDYAAHYDSFFMNVPRLISSSLPMMMREEADTSDVSPSGSPTWVADGWQNRFRFAQLKPNDPVNHYPFYSGCGGAAWLNLFAWHDLAWTPTLLKENNLGDINWTSEFTEEFGAEHLNALADALGTFSPPFSDQGATFPWDMDQGLNYAVSALRHKPYFAYTWALPFDSDAARLAYHSIVVDRKPVIIGYWSDVHYDVAWKHWGSALWGYYYIDFGDDEVRDNIDKGEWVRGDDLFFAAEVYRFERIPYGSYSNEPHLPCVPGKAGQDGYDEGCPDLGD